MAKMSLPRKPADQPVEASSEPMTATLVAERPSEPQAKAAPQRLSAMLAAAIARETDIPRRAALDAIHTALYDLQRRAASVDEHLREDYAPILGRIEAL